MKKNVHGIRLLFVILTLWCNCLSVQVMANEVDYSWVFPDGKVIESPWGGTEVVDNLTAYAYNTDAKSFLAAGNNWGTQAIFNQVGLEWTIANEEGLYTLSSTISNGGDSHFFTGTYTDGAATFFEIESVAENLYTIKYDGMYVAYDGTSIVANVSVLDEGCYWQFVTKEERRARYAEATADNPADATFEIFGANFGRNDGNNHVWVGNPSIGGDNNNFCAEKWNAGISTVSQVLMNMPSGLYRLSAQGFYRMGTIPASIEARNNDAEVLHAKFFANGDSVAVMSILDGANELEGVGTDYTGYGLAPNNMNEASQFFSAGHYEHTLSFALYEGQTDINLGITKTGYVDADWLIFDNFRLTYYGIEGLEDLESSRLEEYLAQMESLMNAADSIDASSATLEAQEELAAAIAVGDSVLLAPNVEALTTSIAQLGTAITRVERSILINAKVKDLSIDIPVDFTQFIVNHDMSEGINGWETTQGWQHQQSTDYVGNGALLSKFQEIWSWNSVGNTSSTQTMIDMPNGTYRISADIMATSQYTGDPKNDVMEAYWIANGNRVNVSTYDGVPEHFFVETEAVDGVLSFGLVGENTTANWLAFDNVTVVSVEREGTLADWLVRLENARKNFAEYMLMLDSMNLIGVKDVLIAKYEEVEAIDETSMEQIRTEIYRMNQLFAEYEEALETYHSLGRLIAECEEYTAYSPVEALLAAIEIARATFLNSSTTFEEYLNAYTTLNEARRMYVGFAKVHVDVQGTLSEKVLSQVVSFESVERLEVSGALNDDDLWCIQNYMTMLKEIDMAAAEVTHLRNRQFEYHYWLKSVTLPATLTTIGYDIFAGCDSLESVISTALIPPYVDGMSFGMNVTNGLTKLYVPEWTINWYKLDDAWDDFAVIKPIEGYWPEHIGIAQDLTLTLPETLPIAYKPSLSIDWSDALNRQSSLTIDGNTSLALKEFGMGYDVEWEARCNGEYITHATLINHAEVTADSISMWVEITNDQWSFLSFPFDVKVSDIRPTMPNTSYAIRKYSGEERAKLNYGNTWQDMTADSILHAGEGYIWQSNRPGYSASAFMVSAANTDNKNNIFAHTDCKVTLNEYIAVNSNNSSWNLIGNPYPAYYDTRAMDFTAPITVWSMYHGSYFAYSPLDDEYILRPSEAFFVQCPEDVEAITFHAEGRQADRVVRSREAQAKAYARNTSERQVFNLTLSNGEKTDRTRFVINAAATCDYEMATDANKFMSSDARVPQLYTVEGDVLLAINERPIGNGVIALGAYFSSNGTYTIALDTKAEGISVVLRDQMMGVETNLMCESYTFYAEAGTVDSRFSVCMRSDEENGDLTGLESLAGKVDITSTAHTITVKAPCVSLIEIYNAEGRCIATAKTTAATFDVEAGVYVVKVQDTVHKVSVK